MGNLVPASLYKCSVTAQTKVGNGEPAVLNVWTRPEGMLTPASEITEQGECLTFVMKGKQF